MRGKQAPKREVLPDAQFNNTVITKFVNYVMYDGKKTVAQAVVYGAMQKIADKTKENPIDVFDRAMKNLQPAVEVKSRRVGGANYQIPTPVRGERKVALAFRWLITIARARKGRAMAEKLADELIAASNNEGDAIKKKMDVHRMAEANRAFAHFAR
jgi:small subunit ribosomal protein S7